MTTKQQPVALRTMQQTASGDQLATVHQRRLARASVNTDENAVLAGKASLIAVCSASNHYQLQPLLIKPLEKPQNQRSLSCQTPSFVYESAATNTDVSLPPLAGEEVSNADRIKKMLLGAEPTSEYWMCLAEQRRIALHDALGENMQLTQECARLREENRQLQFLADEGKQYAALLQECLDGVNTGQ